MKKSGNLAKAFLPIIVVFIVQNALSVVGMEVVFMEKLATFSGGEYSDLVESMFETIQSSEFMVWISICYTIICSIWFSVWYFRLRHNKQHLGGISDVSEVASDLKTESKGVFEGYRWTIVPGLILLAGGLQYLCTYFMNFLSSLFPQWLVNYEQMMENFGLGSVDTFSVPLIVYTIFLGPITEELTFRGLTYTYARRTMTFLGANVFQAILFGLLHMNPLQGIYAGVLGLVFGVIYEKSRNILVTMGLHILFNSAGIVIGTLSAYYSESQMLGDTMISFYFIALGSILVTYFGYELTVKSIPQRVEIEEKF